MSRIIWDAVDRYVVQSLVPEADELEWVVQSNAAAGLPAIDVSAAQGKLLNLLVRMIGAKRVLEIGTLGGYSALWMAHALPPDGRLITLEADAHHAAVAQSNFRRAGVDQLVELCEGPALDALNRMIDGRQPPFNFVFVDADKPSNPEYFSACLKLTRPGSVIVFDNVVRDGKIVDANSDDPRVHGVRKLFEAIAAESRVSATALQTVGNKGYDGLLMMIVNS
ncbi:MAG: O-methyltransferase [Phycisphaerales bacterium]|nr:O-methyltransferase [Phycisphaerales bacterium]MCB9856493.1 O-methyltransferase [Phycisphaerales bacterium]MCB9863974.1 O-methyltransferase [Phycisphaerales bacterium]